MKEEQFLRILNAIKQEAGENDNFIDKEYLDELLEELHLEREQYDMVLQYLENSKIKIRMQEMETVTDATSNTDFQESEREEDTTDTVSHINFYQDEVNALLKISGEESGLLYQQLIGGDKKAKEQITFQYLERVMGLAKLYEGQGVPYEDLVQEGNIGLLMGLDMLGCCESMEEIPGFLGKMIMDAMEACIHEQSRESDLEEMIVKKAEMINKAALNIKEERQRNANISEIEEILGMTEEEVREILTVAGEHIKNVNKHNHD